MRRRSSSASSSPILRTASIAMAAALGDLSGAEECRHLLIRIPDDWEFRRIDDHRLRERIDTVEIGRRHPDGLPAGRYLRVPVEPLVDPWGRVAVGLEFETPEGTQCAELSVQTREERRCDDVLAEDGREAADDGIRLYSRSLLNLTSRGTIFFVEGRAGDVLDLTDDVAGQWSVGDSDGAHRLYIRRDRSGRRSAALAVRCGIEVKLA